MDKTGDFRDGIPFVGGSLWIDFLNTTPLVDGLPRDLIASGTALRRWAGLAALDDPGPQGDAEVAAAQNLRSVLRQGFEALSARQPLPEAMVQAVNACLAGVTRGQRITPTGVETTRHVTGSTILAAVAEDVALCLCTHDPARLGRCANPACNMLFYDKGKNSRRRWCSTAACGNRDKVERYRARKAGKPG